MTADVDRYCELSQQLDEAGSEAFRELEQDPNATREDFEQAEADFVREHEAQLEEITQVAPPEIQDEVQVLISSIRGRAGLEEQAPDEQAERQADQAIQRFERQNLAMPPGATEPGSAPPHRAGASAWRPVGRRPLGTTRISEAGTNPALASP